jgi:hypothetical protein
MESKLTKKISGSSENRTHDLPGNMEKERKANESKRGTVAKIPLFLVFSRSFSKSQYSSCGSKA